MTVVERRYQKPLDLRVVSPVDDFRSVPGNSIWTAVIPEVTRLIDAHRTTLVFCNNRRLAERTADRLNEQPAVRARPARGRAPLAAQRRAAAYRGRRRHVRRRDRRRPARGGRPAADPGPPRLA